MSILSKLSIKTIAVLANVMHRPCLNTTVDSIHPKPITDRVDGEKLGFGRVATIPVLCLMICKAGRTKTTVVATRASTTGCLSNYSSAVAPTRAIVHLYYPLISNSIDLTSLRKGSSPAVMSEGTSAKGAFDAGAVPRQQRHHREPDTCDRGSDDGEVIMSAYSFGNDQG
jgi:hypothetical protein